MDSAAKQRLLLLCELAEQEPDPTRLLALVQEINRLLDEREKACAQEQARGTSDGA